MGLTGHILEVEVSLQRIPSSWIDEESVRIANLEEFLDQLKESGERFPFTVGWIDCIARGKSLGRGILFRGDWATPDRAPGHAPRLRRRVTVPFELPAWVLNGVSARAFNEAVYRSHWRKHRTRLQSWESFFYPLDKVLHWNRVYGRRGFTQFQFVLPETARRGATRRFLEMLTSRGDASFLCVIKDCGAQGKGTLSFPEPGISIALDFPVHAGTQGLIDALNKAVIEEGGRIYLAKDAFTHAEDYRRMDARVDAFLAVRRKWDPALRLRSAQSVRLFGDPA
jgi:FAD/FMN-containing dehydrogenase